MNGDAFNLFLAIVWILVQAGIGYYLFDLTRIARAALKVVASDGADATRLGDEKLKALTLGLAVVPIYIVVGLIVAFQIHDLRLLIGPGIVLGQGVQLRNYRADARLVRELARRIENGGPSLEVFGSEPPAPA